MKTRVMRIPCRLCQGGATVPPAVDVDGCPGCGGRGFLWADLRSNYRLEDRTGRPIPKKYLVLSGTWGAGAAATSRGRVEVADVVGRAMGHVYVTRDSVDDLIALLEYLRDRFDDEGDFVDPGEATDAGS